MLFQHFILILLYLCPSKQESGNLTPVLAEPSSALRAKPR